VCGLCVWGGGEVWEVWEVWAVGGVWGLLGVWAVWAVWGCGVTPYVRHSTDCTCCDFGHLRFYFLEKKSRGPGVFAF
jgi:hypothetical protein